MTEAEAFQAWDDAEHVVSVTWDAYMDAWEKSKAAERAWRRLRDEAEACPHCAGRGRICDHPCAECQTEGAP
jgi:hypothetical protein